MDAEELRWLLKNHPEILDDAQRFSSLLQDARLDGEDSAGLTADGPPRETDPGYFDVEQDAEGCIIKEYIGPKFGDLVIPAKINGKPVTRIGDEAFAGRKGLVGVAIPDGVTWIGDEAFGYCKGLTELTVMGKTTSIHDYAFFESNCLSLIRAPAGSAAEAFAKEQGIRFQAL